MVQLDYTFERQLMLEREENIAEGREEGRIRNQIHMICKKAADRKPLKQIAQELEEKEEDIRGLYETVCLFVPDCDEDKIYQAYMLENPLSVR